MDSNNYFNRDLIFLDKHYKTKEEMFNEIGNILIKKGFVKDGFVEALIERETKYPTGLPVTPFAVAIPHTDPHFVNKKSITIVRLKEPLSFLEMGSLEKKVDVRFAFILTMNESTQVPVLKDLMKLFMDVSFMKKLNQFAYSEVVELIKEI